MVGVGLLWWSWQLIGDSDQPWTLLFLVFGNLWGLGTIVASWAPDSVWDHNPRLTNRLAWTTALLTIGMFVAWAVVSQLGGADYGTDAIAFNQYAAQLVTHGLNPYVHSMKPAFQLFRTPTSFYTYGFNGQPVTTLSYPTLSFLVYVPFIALGLGHNIAPTLNAGAWGLTVVLMFALLPKRIRPVALLFGGYGLYAAFATGGVTDSLFMPMLVVAAYRWDRFGSGGWRTYLGPVMFGLAMGIKQTPWPALPFILLALACDEYARTGLAQALRRAGRYLAIVLVTFLIPNIPWFLASPSGWVKGVLTPLFANMVPTGQGIMSLSLYLHLGGGSLVAFTLATVFMLALLLIAYVGTYPLLRLALYLLPAFAFFVGARSNVNYFISLIPGGFVAAATVGPTLAKGWDPARRLTKTPIGSGLGGALRSYIDRISGPGRFFRSRGWALAACVCTLLLAASVIYSLTASPPVTVKIVGVETDGQLDHIADLTLRVTNTSGTVVKPAFDAVGGGYNSTFWRILHGPKELKPHSHAFYMVQPRNFGASTSTYGGFNMVAYVSNPESFSVSATYKPNLLHIGFDPQAFNNTVPVGQEINVGVQIYGTNGAPLNRAGVPVRLALLTWKAGGPHPAKARVNGGKIGKAGHSNTNAHGIAIFKVVGVRPNLFPVTFTASLKNSQFGYVYGDAGDLTIRFVAR